MSSTASSLDPSIIVSIVAATVFLTAFGSSRPFARLVRLGAEAAWLYLSNTRG